MFFGSMMCASLARGSQCDVQRFDCDSGRRASRLKEQIVSTHLCWLLAKREGFER